MKENNKEWVYHRVLIYFLIFSVLLIALSNLHLDTKEIPYENYIRVDGIKYFTITDSEEDNFKGIICDESVEKDYTYYSGRYWDESYRTYKLDGHGYCTTKWVKYSIILTNT